MVYLPGNIIIGGFMKNRNHSLIPVFIDPKTKQHIPVDKLRECLQNEEIYNVALTGPFGSGKSSVIMP